MNNFDETKLDDDLVSRDLSLSHSYYSWHEYPRQVCLSWKAGLSATVGTFGLIWLLIEPLSLFPDVKLENSLAYPTLLMVSAIVGVGAMAISFLTQCPPGFEKESKAVKNIVRFARPRWQYKAMRLILEKRLASYEDHLDSLKTKHRFIESRSMQWEQYHDWMSDRPDNLISLIEVAKRVLLIQFPKHINSTGVIKNDAENILNYVQIVEDFYKDVYEFEVESYRVQPPSELERAHSIQKEWPASVRDGIRQLLDLLDNLSDPNTTIKAEDFSFTFEPPYKVDEFVTELDVAANRIAGRQ